MIDQVIEVAMACGTALVVSTYVFVARVHSQECVGDEVDDKALEDTLAVLRLTRDTCGHESTMARVKGEAATAENYQHGVRRAQAEIDRILKTGRL
jgi:hypothetical protein